MLAGAQGRQQGAAGGGGGTAAANHPGGCCGLLLPQMCRLPLLMAPQCVGLLRHDVTLCAFPATAAQEHEEAEQFNTGWLEDDEEVVVAEAAASRVSPLAAQPGRVVLSQRRIYFQPFNLAAGAGGIAAYHLGRVVAVAPRVYQLEDLGLEVFFSSRHSLYLAFRRHEDRAAFQLLLMQQPALRLDSMRSREHWTRDWVNGRIRWVC